MGFGEMFMAALQNVLLLGMVVLVLGLVVAAGYVLYWAGVWLLVLVIWVEDKIRGQHDGSANDTP